jgi:hypothetical protein
VRDPGAGSIAALDFHLEVATRGAVLRLDLHRQATGTRA